MVGGCGVVQVAQAVLVPLLVDKDKVGPSSLRAIKSMMVMQPPPSFQVRCILIFVVTTWLPCDRCHLPQASITVIMLRFSKPP